MVEPVSQRAAARSAPAWARGGVGRVGADGGRRTSAALLKRVQLGQCLVVLVAIRPLLGRHDVIDPRP